ncbi:MAG: glycosyltransferase [Nanoarchaeota archaeon]|nr:glycosyltransferase [Nanoarchaeota archaeon]
MEKASIIIPAYNEEKRIGKTLESYGLYFNRLKLNKKIDYELLVVINNTIDNTENVVKTSMIRNPSIRYLNFKKGGKGFAVIEGFKDALTRDNSIIGFVDADMSTPPEEYWKLISSLKKCDGVIASRYIAGSIVNPRQTFQRIVVSRIFNGLIRIVLMMPYRDTQCGAKVFSRKTIEDNLNSLSMSKWAFDVDLIYSMKKKGFKIREVPTYWSDKEYSHINFFKAGPWMALGVIRLRLLNSPLKDLIRVYDKLLNKIWRLK